MSHPADKAGVRLPPNQSAGQTPGRVVVATVGTHTVLSVEPGDEPAILTLASRDAFTRWEVEDFTAGDGVSQNTSSFYYTGPAARVDVPVSRHGATVRATVLALAPFAVDQRTGLQSLTEAAVPRLSARYTRGSTPTAGKRPAVSVGADGSAVYPDTIAGGMMGATYLWHPVQYGTAVNVPGTAPATYTLVNGFTGAAIGAVPVNSGPTPVPAFAAVAVTVAAMMTGTAYLSWVDA